jgi:hypothetical protein
VFLKVLMVDGMVLVVNSLTAIRILAGTVLGACWGTEELGWNE